MTEARDWHFYNFSIDMLITAFGILLGSSLLGAPARSNATGIARAFIILLPCFGGVLVFGSLLPSLEVFSRDDIWTELVVPSLFELLALTIAVREVG